MGSNAPDANPGNLEILREQHQSSRTLTLRLKHEESVRLAMTKSVAVGTANQVTLQFGRK